MYQWFNENLPTSCGIFWKYKRDSCEHNTQNVDDLHLLYGRTNTRSLCLLLHDTTFWNDILELFWKWFHMFYVIAYDYGIWRVTLLKRTKHYAPQNWFRYALDRCLLDPSRRCLVCENCNRIWVLPLLLWQPTVSFVKIVLFVVMELNWTKSNKSDWVKALMMDLCKKYAFVFCSINTFWFWCEVGWVLNDDEKSLWLYMDLNMNGHTVVVARL